MGVTRQELLDAGVPEERCAARSPVTSVPAPAGTATGGAAAVDAATQEQEPEPEPEPEPVSVQFRKLKNLIWDL